MKLLQLLSSSICVICTVTGKDESCQDGRMPASCEDVPNPCENAVCPYYSEAACRVDACNNCSHLFYDEVTGTALKCNDGVLCYDCTVHSLDGNLDCRITMCKEGEVCVTSQFVSTGFFEIMKVDQGCLKKDADLPLNECITEHNLIEKAILGDEGFGEIIPYKGFLFLCNESLCNSNQLFTETCFPDVDECLKPNACTFGCNNTVGSFYCYCPEGFNESADGECTPKKNCTVDNCINGQCYVDQLQGKEICECYNGYELSPQNDTLCVDIDECGESLSNLCDQNCSNNIGAYLCECYKGYRLSTGYNILCEDIDECVENVDDCDPATSTCVNQPGTFRCMCNTGFMRNGSVCQAASEETTLSMLAATPTTTLLKTTEQLTRQGTKSPNTFTNGMLITIFMVSLVMLVTFTFLVNKALCMRKQRSMGRTEIQFLPKSQDHNYSTEPEMDIAFEFKAKEITDRGRIVVESEPLGRGQYGEVFRGTIVGLNGKMDWTTVAVKTPKYDSSVTIKQNFLDEIKLMIDIGEHPHIMPLYGCCTMKEPYYLITEFMKYGALDNFLLRCRSMENATLDPIYNLEELNQVQIAWQISKGMAFLSTTKFFHGDLAARNCLVGANLLVKISDFGLADDIYQKGYKQMAPEKKRPVKWYSPEANLKGVCSTKGDVWSYGVVMWEIYSLGDIPYPGMPAAEVIERIENGYRLPKPDACPSDIYAIMLECWQQSPKERPNFSELEQTLELILHQRAEQDGRVAATSDQNKSPYLHIGDQPGGLTTTSRKSSLAAKLNLNIFFGTSSDIVIMDKSNTPTVSLKVHSNLVGKDKTGVKSLEESPPPFVKRLSVDSFDFDPELISGDSDSAVFLNIFDEEYGSDEGGENAYAGDGKFTLAEKD